MPELSWLSRDTDLRVADQIPYRLLEEVPELSATERDLDTENMIIQGDNLDALKALLPVYAGQVKCIYADPPFNTDQSFPDYDDNLTVTQWAAMIYPRLQLLRELMHEEGTLFLHIDDNQLGNLLVLADEVFGRKSRKAVVTFKQGAATGHKAINPGPVNVSNFVLVYAKNSAQWKPKRLFTSRERDTRYGQFIANVTESPETWQFQPLAKAYASSKNLSIAQVRKEKEEGSYEDNLSAFVLEHAERVVQLVRPDRDEVSKEARALIDESLVNSTRIFVLLRSGLSPMYLVRGQRIIFYKDKLKQVDGRLTAAEPLTNMWTDVLSNNLHNEGAVEFPKSKKPEALIKRCIELSTVDNGFDIVLDAFLGSGTTAAVAHKMKRRYITIEMGEHASTKCAPRLRKVIDGEQGGISEAVGWKGGGGFRFYRLGKPIYDGEGGIDPEIKFPQLAAHIWFTETRTPRPHPRRGEARSPLLGVHNGNGDLSPLQWSAWRPPPAIRQCAHASRPR